MSPFVFYLLLVLLAIVATAAARTPRRPLDRRWQLFRVFFPSWRFFDEPGDEVELLARASVDVEELGSWVRCLQSAPRNWSNVFLNAQGNYTLAAQTVVEQLLSEMGEWDEKQLDRLSESVSFQLTKNLAEFQLRHYLKIPPDSPLKFQFKLAGAGESSGLGDVLISPIYTTGTSE